MKRPLDDWTKQFWSAAYYYRRALDRDRNRALAVLVQVADHTTGKVYDRTIDLLKEIKNGSPSRKD